MSTPLTLSNQFLIAMPGLEDENFSHSVTLLCEHNEQGALGLVINRPMSLKLREMMSQMDLKSDAIDDESQVFWGGPVSQERGFVVHEGPDKYDSTLAINEGLFITTSRDILQAIGQGDGPSRYLVALGYASWGGGQLEDELLQNSWLNAQVDRSILFTSPAKDRWKLATRLLGVDVTQLGSVSGHA